MCVIGLTAVLYFLYLVATKKVSLCVDGQLIAESRDCMQLIAPPWSMTFYLWDWQIFNIV